METELWLVQIYQQKKYPLKTIRKHSQATLIIGKVHTIRTLFKLVDILTVSVNNKYTNFYSTGAKRAISILSNSII